MVAANSDDEFEPAPDSLQEILAIDEPTILSEANKNAYECLVCQEKVTAEKNSKLYRLPPILMLCLQRFSSGVKNNKKIDFPLTGLDMAPYLEKVQPGEDHIYDLYGVVNHTGSLQFGHYFSYVYNEPAGKWFEYNDSIVKEIKKERNIWDKSSGDVDDSLDEASLRSSVVTANAYVLFYKRRGLQMDSEGDYLRLKKSAKGHLDHIFK